MTMHTWRITRFGAYFVNFADSGPIKVGLYGVIDRRRMVTDPRNGDHVELDGGLEAIGVLVHCS